MDPVIFKRGRAVPPRNPLSFYLRYSANGKRHYEPIAADTLDVALVAYQNKAQELDNAARGLGALNGKPAEEPTATSDGITLEQALETFISQQQNKATRTREAYELVAKEFITICGPKNILSKSGRPCALKYRDWLYTQSISETTRVNKMTIVTMFLGHFGIENVYTKKEWPKPNKKEPDAYSHEQIKALLKAAHTIDEQLLLQLFIFSGGRRGEIAHLKKSDIQIRKNGKEELAVVTFKEKPEFGWNTKGKRDRTVRLPLKFAKWVLKVRANYPDDSLLFPNSKGGPNEKHLDRIMRPIGERAGIDMTGKIFHKYRRTYATLKSNEANTQTIQRELGHRSITTTERYLAAAAPEAPEVGRATERAFGEFIK
jgi:integrase